MFEGLDQVPWADFGHGDGQADEVPALLRATMSADNDLRQEAWDDLFQYLWASNSLHEATPHVVPFLLEMLTEPSCPSRFDVAYYLYAIAKMAAHLAGNRREENGQLTEFEQWARESMSAVAKGEGLYRAGFEARDGDKWLRARFAILLVALDPVPAWIGASLMDAALGDRQVQVRVAATLLLGGWAANAAIAGWASGIGGGAQDVLASLAAADVDRAVRWCAAAGVVHRQGDAAGDDALRLVADGLMGEVGGKLGEILEGIQWEPDAPEFIAEMALSGVGEGARRTIIARLVAAVPVAEPGRREELAGRILTLAWSRTDGWRHPPLAGQLSALERHALETLVDCDTLWTGKALDRLGLLNRYRVPWEREKLRVFLGRAPGTVTTADPLDVLPPRTPEPPPIPMKAPPRAPDARPPWWRRWLGQ